MFFSSEMYKRNKTLQPHKTLFKRDTINLYKQVHHGIENNYALFLVMAELESSNDIIGQ